MNKKSEGLNKVQLMGTVLGPIADPGPAGLALQLEVTERVRESDGRWEDETSVWSVLTIPSRAKGLAQLDLDGSRLLVSGVLRHGRHEIYVEARHVWLLGGRRAEPQAPPVVAADVGTEVPF